MLNFSEGKWISGVQQPANLIGQKIELKNSELNFEQQNGPYLDLVNCKLQIED